MEAAEVRKRAFTATVTANDPRSLAQAISAVKSEYGWLVDFEDPPYVSDSELIDVTDSNWRAAHPGARGIKVPAGGAFQADYQAGPEINTDAGKESVLNKVISDYNDSGNPGKFEVRQEEKGRYAIIGVSMKNEGGQEQKVSPILDTPISITTVERSAFETIELIARELSVRTGTKVVLMTAPVNILSQAQVTVGGNNIPARTLLLQTLNATKRPMIWQLLYESNMPLYAFNISVATHAQVDTYGRRREFPIDFPAAARKQ